MKDTTAGRYGAVSRRHLLAGLAGGATACVAGCSSNAGGNGTSNETDATGLPESVTELPPVDGSYDTVTAASFNTLNPLYNTESGAGTAIGRALDLGYTFDSAQDLFPLLYDLSTDDGAVWVFTLREGLQFSDPYGEVDAEAFTYQIEEIHQSEWANTPSAPDWRGVNIEQTGALEFQAELPESQLLWPESFEPLEYPIPPTLVEPYVDEEDTEGLKQESELLELSFTGNLGPYMLDSWNRGAGTSYVRNDDYYLQDIEDGPQLFNMPHTSRPLQSMW
jgi:Bacterial extracellular solute-binding proteins, family 5 Middle.